MHNYPSDISREQYEIIREEIEGAKKKTRPRKVDLYDVFCAVLYVVKGEYNGGCCLQIFRNGSCAIIISGYGLKKLMEKTLKVFWNEF